MPLAFKSVCIGLLLFLGINLKLSAIAPLTFAETVITGFFSNGTMTLPSVIVLAPSFADITSNSTFLAEKITL